jgi:hypothetical protein
MSNTLEIEDRVRRPIESDPEHGEVIAYGVVLTRGLYWVDAGNHVFRSVEFDVMGEGEDRDSAFVAFVENLEDLVSDLTETVDADDATRDEVDAFVALSSRFLEAYKRHENEKRPLIEVNLPRRRPRRQHGRSWRSTRTSSSAVLSA